MSSSLSHTRSGPTGFLSWSLKESMRPLHLITLSASSGWQGFWSRLIACATSLGLSAVFFTMMPRESPTFEQKSFYPMVTTTTQVEPENRMSKAPPKRVSLASRKALLKAIQISSVLSASAF